MFRIRQSDWHHLLEKSLGSLRLYLILRNAEVAEPENLFSSSYDSWGDQEIILVICRKGESDERCDRDAEMIRCAVLGNCNAEVQS